MTSRPRIEHGEQEVTHVSVMTPPARQRVIDDQPIDLTQEPFGGWVDVTAELPCRHHDGELWFAERPAEVERAKALCGDCPLQVRCLEGALRRREPWGVWGGQLFMQGTIVARKRPRGRPRKNAA